MTFFLVVAMACLPYLFKKINGNDISITVNESKEQFKISADFPDDKTRSVQRCLDKSLDPSGMSFVNTRIDGEISPGNGMLFFLKLSPGHLNIKLDKRKNSPGSYRKMKELGEDLKEVLTKN